MAGRLTVSVALATYNGERFLGEQLDSLLGQSRLPDEIVVVDDASTDGTPALLEAFARRHPGLVRFRQLSRNGGPSAAFAEAIEDCRSEIVFLCDQDDRWHPEKVARFLAELEAHDGLGFVASDSRLIDEEGHEVGSSLWRRLRVPAGYVRRRTPRRAFRALLRFPFVPGHAMALRRHLLEGALPIPAAWTHDEWLSVYSTAQSEGLFLSEPLTHYRLHRGQTMGAEPESLREKVKTRAAGRDAAALEAQLRRAEALAKAAELLAGRRELGDGVAELVAARLRYLRARAQMTRSSLPLRLLLIAREALSGRYWRVGRGGLAIARDLILRRNDGALAGETR